MYYGFCVPVAVRSIPVPRLFPKTLRDLPALRSQLEQPASSGWREQSCFPLMLHQGTFPYNSKIPALLLRAGIHECQGCESTNWPFLCLQALSSMPVLGQHTSGKSIHPLQFQKPLQLAKLPSTASKGNPAGTLSHCSAHSTNFPFLAGKSGPLPNCCTLSKKYQVT